MRVVGSDCLERHCSLWIFHNKTSGFGRYNTSVLVVILAISFGCIALISGFLPGQAFSGLLMAVVGFAGGMVVGKEQS